MNLFQFLDQHSDDERAKCMTNIEQCQLDKICLFTSLGVLMEAFFGRPRFLFWIEELRKILELDE